MIRVATAAGRFSRVRVVDVPLADYTRFGLHCSQYNNAAGEDIHYLTRDRAEATQLPDDADVLLGGEIVEEPAEIGQHNYSRDAAWHHAARRDDFGTEQRLGRA